MNLPTSAVTQPAPLFVEQLRSHATAFPAALAIRAPGGERSMRELVSRSERIAARLREAGCKPGDRVVVLGRPSLVWLDVMVGAMFARCAFAPLSTALTLGEQINLLADAQPRLIFAANEFAEQGGCPQEITVRLENLEDWIAAGTGTGSPDIPEGDDLFSIIYSSGTTGVPKGIAHTAGGRAEFIAARPRPGFGPGRISYVSTSPYTNFSFLGIISPLYFGAGVSVPARFTVEGFLEAVPAEKITDVSLVPVQVKRILEHPNFDPARLVSLTFTMISGSPLEPAIKSRLAGIWPGRIVDSYGTTETGGVATLDLKAYPDKLDTVGKIMSGVEIVILDEEAKPLPSGSVGEIAVVTPQPMAGYFNREDLTAHARWRDDKGRSHIITGDIGLVDEDNFLHITGRAKDMIISGGLNIFACDIEAVLCDHPAVAEAAVIAIPDERWGECPYAIVVLRDGVEISVAELHSWMQARLARTSWPVGLELVAALPRNDMGKVLKRVLREPFWKGKNRDVA